MECRLMGVFANAVKYSEVGLEDAIKCSNTSTATRKLFSTKLGNLFGGTLSTICGDCLIISRSVSNFSEDKVTSMDRIRSSLLEGE
mmetsp:Transcript_15509/g.19748  ORF Transcript_15509/g.19748 Transcript_15509/m.19748 type:complete len:86 (-) Transcript_15509:687-944(-)